PPAGRLVPWWRWGPRHRHSLPSTCPVLAGGSLGWRAADHLPHPLRRRDRAWRPRPTRQRCANAAPTLAPEFPSTTAPLTVAPQTPAPDSTRTPRETPGGGGGGSGGQPTRTTSPTVTPSPTVSETPTPTNTPTPTPAVCSYCGLDY